VLVELRTMKTCLSLRTRVCVEGEKFALFRCVSSLHIELFHRVMQANKHCNDVTLIFIYLLVAGASHCVGSNNTGRLRRYWLVPGRHVFGRKLHLGERRRVRVRVEGLLSFWRQPVLLHCVAVSLIFAASDRSAPVDAPGMRLCGDWWFSENVL